MPQERNSTVTTLINELTNRESSVREGAARALGKMGPGAEEAVPALIKTITDRKVRDEATEALGKIGPGAKEAVPVLIQALKAANYWTKTKIIEALGKIGPEAKEAEKNIEEFRLTAQEKQTESPTLNSGNQNEVAKHSNSNIEKTSKDAEKPDQKLSSTDQDKTIDPNSNASKDRFKT